MKIYEVREKINENTVVLIESKFGLNDTWFDAQTFSFAGPMQLQPINRILLIKINLDLQSALDNDSLT